MYIEFDDAYNEFLEIYIEKLEEFYGCKYPTFIHKHFDKMFDIILNEAIKPIRYLGDYPMEIFLQRRDIDETDVEHYSYCNGDLLCTQIYDEIFEECCNYAGLDMLPEVFHQYGYHDENQLDKMYFDLAEAYKVYGRPKIYAAYSKYTMALYKKSANLGNAEAKFILDVLSKN